MAIFLPLSSVDLGDAEVLAHHHRAGRADGLDLRDGDEAALVVADDEGRPGVGAHVDLPRHHLLHGEVAGRHREVLGLEPALLQIAGLHQVVGRHAPDVGLVALADGDVGGRRRRMPPSPPSSAAAPVAARICRRFIRIEFDRHVVLPVRPDRPDCLFLLHSEFADCSLNVVHRLCDDLSQLLRRRGFRQRAALLDQVAVVRRRHDRRRYGG